MPKKPRLPAYMPLIVGGILGVISVVIGKIPHSVAVWSGLNVLGNHDGYLWGALLVAYVNAKSWKRSFITSALTPVIATVIYYAAAILFRIFGIGMTKSFGAIAKSFVVWSVIGVVAGALAATAMRFALYDRRKPLRYGALAVPYLAFIVMCGINAVRVIGWLQHPDYLTGSWMGYNFYEDVFEIGFTLAVTTLLFVIAMRRARRAGAGIEIA